ncbi:sensor histidine kinase KdpD [Pseudonocardia sp. WMMC193]|uniref:sensor histidine kinase n=1 Tax=Pseudonocardia sp. WMMC193 TaxID=2911965 RepID=UPI001F46536B|nr:HAMP domain-containing sensor histidine kinase [Pseudonocardia sp. WMMC193]MCF7550720.1 HAMP domain-containing histidine kinase [Pseudonocardia sp. WMMC193]
MITVGPRQGWDRRDVANVVRERPDALVVLAIRVCVAASLLALALLPVPVAERFRPALLVTVVVALAYAGGLVVIRLVVARSPKAWVVSLADSLLTLLACALTGGTASLAVAALPLVVIAASLRVEKNWGVGLAATLGLTLTASGLAGASAADVGDVLVRGGWWTFYLVATALLVSVFLRRIRRGYELTAETRAEAIAERHALEAERDLRSRLLTAQNARLDGLRVILHEFRTPVASISALARSAERRDDASDDPMLGLISANARHLEDMLNGLADVALADGNPTGRVRDRTVRLADLAASVISAAGLAPAESSWSVGPPDATVVCDPQRLRRILVNLTENARRHGGGAVELDLSRRENALVVEVRDRGPGLPDDQLGVVTSLYTSLGDRRGTSGLGLWIVQELTTAMDGILTLRKRSGGGLVAHLRLPVRWV